jgi:hypothetical protein
VVTALLTLSQRVEDFPPHLLPIQAFHECLVESGKKSVFHRGMGISARSTRVVVGSTSADGQRKVDDFVRPYVLGLPHRDIQGVVVVETTILERSEISQKSGLKKPVNY